MDERINEELTKVASTIFNWGIQNFRLSGPTSGMQCERLIGKALAFIPYCWSLKGFEGDMSSAYSKALEMKEEQHEKRTLHFDESP
jgi:hypothetical protein